MAQRGLKAADISKATGITTPVLSRYLSGKSGISAKNLVKLSQYLNISPDWLLDGSDAPESIKMSKSVSVDKDKIIEVQGRLIDNLQKWMADKDRQIVELVKNCEALATKPNKHKPKK